MTFNVIETCPSFEYSIYIAGNYEDILRECKKFCTEQSYCVSVMPCDFPYKFGHESGAKISLINYPRFPKGIIETEKFAIDLGHKLAEACYQASFTIQGPEYAKFYSRKNS